MVIRISDKTQNYSKVTKLLVKPKYFGNKRPTPEEYIYKITKKTKV